ncbi:MAG: class I tRNA ligase family protein, partial [Oscillospiraceae bacterium]|nr:class I tRNA ligase family protein [Oscillospiraceae bacterium]
LELDRWAMTRLNKLIETGFKAYDNYEFHVLTHAINDFCVVELSQFYLDILKDRLYCDEKDGLRRRSAQTAIYLILDTMAKLFAPILAFTCDEIWQAMPHRKGDDARNVVFNDMNKPFTDYALDADTMAKWDTLIRVREDVYGVLEQARADKRIGKALEAQVSLQASESACRDGSQPSAAALADAAAALDAISGLDLAELFIVSAVSTGEAAAADNAIVAQGTNYPGLTVTVSEAAGKKCPRCWMHSTKANAEGLCPRCAKVVETLL